MLSVLLYALFILAAAALPLNSPLIDSYDYIVVGGGPGGLTVANRLSEDANFNVLLLEAGPADNAEPYVEMPGLLGLDIGSRYDWNLSTVPQIYLDGRRCNIPQGHALGGGTLLNGMLWNRGGQGDYDDWVALGNPESEAVIPFTDAQQSETFTPLESVDLRLQYSIAEDFQAHGYDGPVNVSFPDYFWNASGILFDALNELGVPTAYDPNNGQLAGASFLPLDLDPQDKTRSTARKAYYDPFASRPNLWVSTGQYVTQILFENASVNGNSNANAPSRGQGSSPGVPGGIYGSTTTVEIAGNGPPAKRTLFSALWSRIFRRQIPSAPASAGRLRAVGVEFAPTSGALRRSVTASREVIVSAGALHSPQLLMLSGIGPVPHLRTVNIPVHIELPGVGSNLQDHGQVWAFYPYQNNSYDTPLDLSRDQGFLTSAWEEYWANRTGPFTTSTIGGVAFPALPFVVNGSEVIGDSAGGQTYTQFLPPTTHPDVLAGYQRQLPLLVDALNNATRGSYELLNGNDGVLTVATMRPFSRGTVLLNSSQPFDPPLIDPRYASNPIDLQVLAAALRFNERLIRTNSLAILQPIQMAPGAESTSDELLQYIRTRMQTEYHPSGTCAMMPRNLGGVVNPDLLVYGTENVRVIDSSIMPTIPAAHLQAVVYAIAEKGADIIKLANAGEVPAPETLPSPTTTAAAAAGVTTVTVMVTQTVYL